MPTESALQWIVQLGAMGILLALGWGLWLFINEKWWPHHTKIVELRESKNLRVPDQLAKILMTIKKLVQENKVWAIRENEMIANFTKMILDFKRTRQLIQEIRGEQQLLKRDLADVKRLLARLESRLGGLESPLSETPPVPPSDEKILS